MISIHLVTDEVLPRIAEIIAQQFGGTNNVVECFNAEDAIKYYAEIDGTIVGASLMEISTIGENLQKYFGTYVDLELVKGIPAGIVTLIAVEESFQHEGVGTALYEFSEEVMISQGVKVLVAEGWKSSDKGTHIEPLLLNCGYEKVVEAPLAWYEESFRYDEICVRCGKPPCLCSLVLFVKYLDDAVPHLTLL